MSYNRKMGHLFIGVPFMIHSQSLLVRLKVFFAGKAYGACPVFGQVFEICTRKYVVLGVTDVWVIYPFAYSASILLHGVGGF